MDELTRERFLTLPWWESRRQPAPKHERRPVSTEAQQLLRRAELLEALDGWSTRHV